MKLTNQQMDMALNVLQEISTKTSGKLGYIVAKNMRILSNELVEYYKIKDETIKELGSPDDEGHYSIKVDSSEFKQFVAKMQEYADIETDVNIITIDPELIYSTDITGAEINAMLFMINDEEE